MTSRCGCFRTCSEKWQPTRCVGLVLPRLGIVFVGAVLCFKSLTCRTRFEGAEGATSNRYLSFMRVGASTCLVSCPCLQWPRSLLDQVPSLPPPPTLPLGAQRVHSSRLRVWRLR